MAFVALNRAAQDVGSPLCDGAVDPVKGAASAAALGVPNTLATHDAVGCPNRTPLVRQSDAWVRPGLPRIRPQTAGATWAHPTLGAWHRLKESPILHVNTRRHSAAPGGHDRLLGGRRSRWGYAVTFPSPLPEDCGSV